MDLADQLAGPPPAEHATAAAGDARSYTREDGTLVIDILVDPRCGASAEGVIVVCAIEETGERPVRADPPPKEPATIEVQLAPNLTVGPRTESGRDGEVKVMVDLTLTF